MSITFIIIAVIVAAFVYVVLAHVGMLLVRKLFRLPQKRHESLFAQQVEDHYGGQTPSMEERRSLRRQGQRR